MRSQGLGSQLLGLLREYYAHYRGIFGEAEAPENGAPEGEPLRRRRLAFYERNGFRYGGYDCALFGVHYQTLIMGDEDVTPEELMQSGALEQVFAVRLHKTGDGFYAISK